MHLAITTNNSRVVFKEVAIHNDLLVQVMFVLPLLGIKVPRQHNLPRTTATIAITFIPVINILRVVSRGTLSMVISTLLGLINLVKILTSVELLLLPKYCVRIRAMVPKHNMYRNISIRKNSLLRITSLLPTPNLSRSSNIDSSRNISSSIQLLVLVETTRILLLLLPLVQLHLTINNILTPHTLI